GGGWGVAGGARRGHSQRDLISRERQRLPSASNRRGRQTASPPKHSEPSASGSEAEPRAGDGPFRHGIVLIDSVAAHPDRADQTPGRAACINRLAAGERDNPPLSHAGVVIADGSGH